MKPATAELFVEIRCEELPARFVAPIAEGLRDGLVKLLKAVDHGAVRVWATPRVAVAIADVGRHPPGQRPSWSPPPAAAAWRDGA